MPKVSEAHLSSQRTRILDAAVGVFAQRGFQQATIQDVCRRADISHGALYRYFPSKEALIEATAARLRDEFMAGFEQAASRDASFAEIVDGLSPEAFDWLAVPGASTYLSIHLKWWAEAVGNPGVRSVLVEGFFNVWREALARIIARAQERGELRSDIEPGALASAFLSLYYGLVLQKALDPSLDVAAYAQAARALYQSALNVERP
jgi:AcrR family transcriptional regulator